MVPFLTRGLAGQFDVSRPQLPEPDAEIWATEIDNQLEGLPEDAVLVGHSLGGSMLLKVIAERRAGLRAAGLVLMAPPWWGPTGWDAQSYALPEDFASTLNGLGAVIHMQGRADEVVPFAHQAIYAQQMPAARFVALDGVTHDLSGAGQAAVLDAIKSV